jgi:1,4-alpha-glucan branching enzyme
MQTYVRWKILSEEASPQSVATPPEIPTEAPAAAGGKGVPAAASVVAGCLSFTLHAHLPYVINHGTWPHGLEWLLEAAAETYLLLLRMFGRLERDGIALHCNIDLSPVLLEQLAHPVFIAEFPNYVTRKIVAAREDEAFFLQLGDQRLAATARYWQDFYVRTLIDFNAFGRSIVSGFRHFNDAGLIRVITSAATHGFLPLLGTDESVRAQIRLAVDTHTRHLGVAPKGVWLPECGYRPAGYWEYPEVGSGHPTAAGFTRDGIDQCLAETGLGFFFVDSPLVEGSAAMALRNERRSRPRAANVYRPHQVASKAVSASGNGNGHLPSTAVFARDPRTAVQVWSSDAGYPGDFNYLDFHKKRFPGGHRYWKVTGAHVGIEDKHPYDPAAAAERVQVHAAHFAGLVREALQPSAKSGAPPILNALFDAELFGHWWFEGVLWLEAVARELHAHAADPASARIELIDCESYLKLYPPSASISMSEGSWGAGGSSQVWLNPQTSWTYARLYPAQLYVRELATSGRWRESDLGARIARQLCRELLLLESSDWQFLISTGTARDYAERRFNDHLGQFNELCRAYEEYLASGSLPEPQTARLSEIEGRDSIFADLDPGLWASSAAIPQAGMGCPLGPETATSTG